MTISVSRPQSITRHVASTVASAALSALGLEMKIAVAESSRFSKVVIYLIAYGVYRFALEARG